MTATTEPRDTLLDTDILPVQCPRCGEAQNTMQGSTDPFALDAEIGCMVCGYSFGPGEYRELLGKRQSDFAGLQVDLG